MADPFPTTSDNHHYHRSERHGIYDCTVTANARISSAVKLCTNILLSGVSAPASSTLSLALQTGAALTFAGETTFGTTADSNFDPIVLTGTDITVTRAPNHVVDGQQPGVLGRPRVQRRGRQAGPLICRQGRVKRCNC